MDETEITNHQFKVCVAAGGCDSPVSGDGRYRRSEYYDKPEFANYPVVWMSWFDARDYCQWVGERLPTEAEWEKAARGEDGRIYPWGNTFDAARANTQDNGDERLRPVGQYSLGVSPYGIYDLVGNVWEYVEDWFDPDYYSISPYRDPTGPPSSPDGEKVLRGGSYANLLHYNRTAIRGFVPANSRTQFRGFRCVIDDELVSP
jgi:formylglycine-generating enzyme required for sulfatase activity